MVSPNCSTTSRSCSKQFSLSVLFLLCCCFFFFTALPSLSSCTPITTTTTTTNHRDQIVSNHDAFSLASYWNKNEVLEERIALNAPYSFDVLEEGFFAPMMIHDDIPNSPYFYLLFTNSANPGTPIPEVSVLKVQISTFTIVERLSLIHPFFYTSSSHRFECAIMTSTKSVAAKRLVCGSSVFTFSFRLQGDVLFEPLIDQDINFLAMDHDGEYGYVVGDDIDDFIWIFRIDLETGQVVNRNRFLFKAFSISARLKCEKMSDGSWSSNLILFKTDVDSRELQMYHISKSTLKLVNGPIPLGNTDFLARSQVLRFNNDYYIAHTPNTDNPHLNSTTLIHSSVRVTRIRVNESMAITDRETVTIVPSVVFGPSSIKYTHVVMIPKGDNGISISVACPGDVLVAVQIDRYNLSITNTFFNGTSPYREGMIQYFAILSDSTMISVIDETTRQIVNMNTVRLLSIDRIAKPGVLTQSKIWEKKDSKGLVLYSMLLFGTFEGELILVSTSYTFPLYKVVAVSDSKIVSFDIDQRTDSLYIVSGSHQPKVRKYNLATMEFDSSFAQLDIQQRYPENLLFLNDRIFVTTKESTIMLNSVGEWIGERILPDVKTYKGGAVKLGNDKIVYGTDMGIYLINIPRSTNVPEVSRAIQSEKAVILFKSSDDNCVYYASNTAVKRLDVRSFDRSTVIDVSRHCHPLVNQITGVPFGDSNLAYIACQSKSAEYHNILLVNLKTGTVLNGTYVNFLTYKMQVLDMYEKILLVSSYGQVKEIYPLAYSDNEPEKNSNSPTIRIIIIATTSSVGGFLLLCVLSMLLVMIVVACGKRKSNWKKLVDDNTCDDIEVGNSIIMNDSELTYRNEEISKRLLESHTSCNNSKQSVGCSEKLLSKLEGLKIPRVPLEEIEMSREVEFGSLIGLWRGTFIHAKKIQNRVTDSFINKLNPISTISHPNLNKIVGYALSDNNDFYVVSEREDAISLYDWLYSEEYRDYPREFSHKRMILTEVCRTLHFLSQQQPPIHHNNIRAQTILVEEDLSIKLINWCSCYKASESARKIAYVAPEVLKQPNACSSKSDVYSIGILMWELFFMWKPFTPLPVLGAPAKQTEQATKSRMNLFTLGMCVMNGSRPDLPDFAESSSLFAWYYRCHRGSEEDVPEPVLRNYFSLMQRCWHENPELRPSLFELLDALDRDFE